MTKQARVQLALVVQGHAPELPVLLVRLDQGQQAVDQDRVLVHRAAVQESRQQVVRKAVVQDRAAVHQVDPESRKVLPVVDQLPARENQHLAAVQNRAVARRVDPANHNQDLAHGRQVEVAAVMRRAEVEVRKAEVDRQFHANRYLVANIQAVNRIKRFSFFITVICLFDQRHS